MTSAEVPGRATGTASDGGTEKPGTPVLRAARIPAGRMGPAAEIAGAVAYLASEEAASVTGETIHIPGGMAMI